MPRPLACIVDQLKREPSRTGSIVITVFGDAIVPRGGSVWLGTLLEFFKGLDIDSGVVRTAMSRLATDGWLERNKVGRNSFYRLAKTGRQTFDAATKHIYDPPPSGWRPALCRSGFLRRCGKRGWRSNCWRRGTCARRSRRCR